MLVKAQLDSANANLRKWTDSGDSSALAEAVKVLVSDIDFLAWMAKDPSRPRAIRTPEELQSIVYRYLYYVLYHRDYPSAALLLWGHEVFSPEPKSVKLVWKALFENTLTAVMGASAQGKSYGAAAWHLLDWLLDPQWTRIEILSTDSEHLKKNLWGDIQRLYSGASIKLPGTADALSIYASEEAKRNGFGFFVVFAERGQDSKGKLKGGHSRPRTGEPHPLFGRSTRRRIIMDEAQEIPPATFDDIPNIVAAASGVEHIKVFTAANPKDEFSRYGLSCRPVGGWAAIGPLDETWMSELGWSVVRLNAMLSENVVEKRVVYPRMQTYEGVQKAIRNAGGDTNAPAIWTYVYGMFPPQGLSTTIIKGNHVEAARGEACFIGAVTPIAALDPAFVGDRPAFCFGRAGEASGYTPTGGSFIAFQKPRHVVQIDAVTILSHGDTQDIVDQALTKCRQLYVKAEHFGIDKTGTGTGVFDIARRQWARFMNARNPYEVADILGVGYSEAPSEVPVSDEDTTKPKDMYVNTATELWYAAAKLFEFGCVFLGKAVDAAAIQELTSRRGSNAAGHGKKLAVESKKDYKARGQQSPDLADTITICIHVARLRLSNAVKAIADKTPEQRVQPLEQWAQTTAFQGWAEAFQHGKSIDTITD